MLLRRGLLLWGALVEGTVDACGTEGVTVSRAEELVLGCARARQPGVRLQDVFCVTRQVEPDPDIRWHDPFFMAELVLGTGRHG